LFMRFTAALVTPGAFESARCTVAWHAAQVMPSTGRVILRACGLAGLRACTDGMSGLRGYLKAGAFDGGLDGLRRGAVVEAEMRLADLDRDRLDARHGLEHASEAVDAAAARHALD